MPERSADFASWRSPRMLKPYAEIPPQGDVVMDSADIPPNMRGALVLYFLRKDLPTVKLNGVDAEGGNRIIARIRTSHVRTVAELKELLWA